MKRETWYLSRPEWKHRHSGRIPRSMLSWSRYFRGEAGTGKRETSIRDLVLRVVETVTRWGSEQGYFASDEDAEAFRDELICLLIHQRATFNSPVWFNVGIDPTPQCSACFILSVEDTMESILHWYAQEGLIFKGGSGSGVNLSKLRSSTEPLGGGGTASGSDLVHEGR